MSKRPFQTLIRACDLTGKAVLGTTASIVGVASTWMAFDFLPTSLAPLLAEGTAIGLAAGGTAFVLPRAISYATAEVMSVLKNDSREDNSKAEVLGTSENCDREVISPSPPTVDFQQNVAPLQSRSYSQSGGSPREGVTNRTETETRYFSEVNVCLASLRDRVDTPPAPEAEEPETPSLQ